ncbi:chromatin assembly factor 1 subunit A-domain-containing protein [Limtongia smithiae]|uniref:chromatin assembly factor 1 subunit A-domain-containing protein n=1 Tax=Limtongia smithiae TaxID=1125753 RepID=UPI0034CF6777
MLDSTVLSLHSSMVSSSPLIGEIVSDRVNISGDDVTGAQTNAPVATMTNYMPPPEPPRHNIQIISEGEEDTSPDIAVLVVSKTSGNVQTPPSDPRKRKAKLTEQEVAEREENKRKKTEESERRKAEKAVKDAEKEEKRRAREEEKKAKDEEKRVKEEEKRRREEERKAKEEERRRKDEEKRRRRDEEKRKKDDEKKKKEDEIKEKEKKQLRLGSFFKIPPTTSSTTTKTTIEESNSNLDDKEVEVGNLESSKNRAASVSDSIEEPPKSTLDSIFFPFHIRDRVELFPLHSFSRDEAGLRVISRNIDAIFEKQSDISRATILIPESSGRVPNFASIMNLRPDQTRKRGKRAKQTTKEVIAQFGMLNGPFEKANEPNGLTEEELRARIQALPRKFLKLCEDLRPPYYGTFTKTCKIPRNNPFFRDDSINYDYDSEIEWVQGDGEGGEDIDDASDSEPDDTSNDFIDDEMRDFLVAEDANEDTQQPKRRILAPLVPFMKGVCFTDLKTNINKDFDGLGMDIATIQPNITLPIDPFKDYWSTSKKADKVEKIKVKSKQLSL